MIRKFDSEGESSKKKRKKSGIELSNQELLVELITTGRKLALRTTMAARILGAKAREMCNG